MKQLILKKKNDRWFDQETGHVNYGLDNALAEIFHRTGNRNFYIEGDLVYLVIASDPKPKETEKTKIRSIVYL